MIGVHEFTGCRIKHCACKKNFCWFCLDIADNYSKLQCVIDRDGSPYLLCLKGDQVAPIQPPI